MILEVSVEKAPAIIFAARTLMAAAGPAQRLLKGPLLTHSMCNRQAVRILYHDGFKEFAQITDSHFAFLEKGTTWADDGFRNMAHFYNPRSSRGIYGWTDAVRECGLFWNKAVQSWRQNKIDKAFFYLGGAVHLVQDLCVPHHAMGILLDGHAEYEAWAEENRDQFSAESKGMYHLADGPGGWVRRNACAAVRRYHLVRDKAQADSLQKATAVLLPRAQRTTAGLLHLFLSKIQ